jgi:predicted phosphodiesterase
MTFTRGLKGGIGILATGLGLWLALPSSLGEARPARAPEFLIRPYLFALGSDSLGLAWQYKSGLPRGVAAQAVISRGRETIATLEAGNDEGLRFVRLPIGACGYGEGVTYRVTGQEEPVEIEAIPCASEATVSRFTFIADSQDGPEHVRKFAADMARFPGTAVVHGGDIVQKGSKFDEWVAYFAAMAPVGQTRPLVMAVGNHEYVGDLSVPLWKRFFRQQARQSHYAFELGSVRVLVLNSCFADDPSIVEPQLAWLRNELGKRFDGWTVVLFHHPAYSVGVANSVMNPRAEWRIVQEKFVPLFESMGVDLVLNGHTHIFERSRKNGVEYLIAGPAGGMIGIAGTENPWTLYSNRTRTMTHFEADSRNLRAVTLDQDGRSLDDLRLSR